MGSKGRRETPACPVTPMSSLRCCGNPLRGVRVNWDRWTKQSSLGWLESRARRELVARRDLQADRGSLGARVIQVCGGSKERRVSHVGSVPQLRRHWKGQQQWWLCLEHQDRRAGMVPLAERASLVMLVRKDRRGTRAALGTRVYQAQMDCQGCRVSQASGVRPAPKARRETPVNPALHCRGHSQM